MLAFSDNNAFFHQEVQNCLLHAKTITTAEMCISDEEVGRHWKLLFPGALCNTCSFLSEMLLCTQLSSLKLWTEFVAGTVSKCFLHLNLDG